MDWSRSHVKLFRALLYWYPAEFRHEYGAEMEAVFAARLNAAKGEPRTRLWLHTIADTALSAVREHAHVLHADLRHGVRILAATPAFTSLALLVIALGIGASVATFSVVNAVLLRSLPYGHPDQLVYLFSPNNNFKGVPAELGPNVPDFYEWQRLSHSFTGLTMLKSGAVNLVQAGADTERLQAAWVTDTFFQVMEARPELGRTPTSKDEQHVALISHRLWQTRFAADPDILGRSIQLNRQPYTVIGVMPKNFGYPFDGDIPYEQSGHPQTDVWAPLVFTPAQRTDRTNFASATAAIGRLQNGVSPAAAEQELAPLEARLGLLYPEMWRGWTVLVRPLVQTIIGPVEKMLWLLTGAVAMVLLIAISNIANLLLARATVRAHEFGIRTALGAARARIIRQLLSESLLLSGAGGLLGIALAYAAVRLLIRFQPGNIPRFDTANLDTRVLFAAIALSLLTGLLAGLAPALSASTPHSLATVLRSTSNRIAGSKNLARGRLALIVCQVALSVILMVGAGLLIRSYLQLAAVDTGFNPATLTFRLPLDERYHTPDRQRAFHRDFLAKLQALPGVRLAAASNSIPLSHQESMTFVQIRGAATPAKEMIEGRSVTPDYRAAMGTPLLRGRDFDRHDIGAKSRVVLINEKFARVYFPDRDPLGAQLRLGMGNDTSNLTWETVVGVVGNIRHTSLEEESQPQVFEPVDSGENFALQCSGTSNPTQVSSAARAALHALDPVLTLEHVSTMNDYIHENNARRNFQTALLTSFAVIAIALGLAGLYGLMAYTVKQRTAEIGIRLAIGASRSRILRLVLWQGLRVTAVGLVFGLAGALALTRVMTRLLFGITPLDPLTFVIAPLFVFAVAAGACLIPAYNATLIDPVQALKQE